MITPSSYGALSATSANTIKGNAPTIQNNRLGFKVNGESYSEAIGNINSSVAKAFDSGLSLSHFTLIDLTNADYYDADGDIAHPSTPFTTGTKIMKWYDRNGAEITDTNKMLGCGNNYNLPLKLRIEVKDVVAHSKYGDPRDSAPITLTKEYLISTTSGICYIRPASVDWYDVGTGATRSPTQGGGYTADFDPDNGFKANPTVSSVKFPTTGFAKARFWLKMTGHPLDWNYTVRTDPNRAVTVDTNGMVTINKKPTGAITVRATLKSSSSIYFDYTFNPTRLWVTPKKNDARNSIGQYTYAKAKTACGRESRITTREQLTNSPLSRLPPAGPNVRNAYTRAIGKLDIGAGAEPMQESIFSEWGFMSAAHHYTGSLFFEGAYWTRDSPSLGYRYHVGSNYGFVYWHEESETFYVACLG
ncbi:hypothetical protein RCS94_07945 [Orbaceae bacterium ac157xtp]